MTKKMTIVEPNYTNIQKQTKKQPKLEKNKKYFDFIIDKKFLKTYFSVIKIKVLK